jgi:hypothetical protein
MRSVSIRQSFLYTSQIRFQLIESTPKTLFHIVFNGIVSLNLIFGGVDRIDIRPTTHLSQPGDC